MDLKASYLDCRKKEEEKNRKKKLKEIYSYVSV